MICIYDEITQNTASEIAWQITEGVEVRINSAGGNVFSAITIYNLLKEARAKITVDGLAASAATLLLCAGHTKASRHSIIIIHNPLLELSDCYTAAELDQLKNTLETLKKTILQIYATKMKVSEDEISAMMDAETWLSAEEALNLGLIDEIDDALEVKNMADSGKFLMAKYKNSVLAMDKKRRQTLQAAKCESAEVNALIDYAAENQLELSEIQPYINAIKEVQKGKPAVNMEVLAKLLQDNLTSGAAEVGGSVPQDKKAAQAEMLAKFANEMAGVVK